MIISHQAFANVSGQRLRGDVVKENHHTVWMVFHPSKELKQKLLKEHNILAVPTKPIKRHLRKHKVSRFM